MNIKQVLTIMATNKNIDIKDLKTLYKKIEARKTKEFDGIDLPPEHLAEIVLNELGKRYDLTESEVGQYIIVADINESDEKITKPEETLPPATKERGGNWKDFMKNIEPPKEKIFESNPFLVLMDGAKYTMSLLDPTKEPYAYENKKGKDSYTSYFFDIILHSVSPDYMYDEEYDKTYIDKNDNVIYQKGDKMYIDDKHYTLSLYATDDNSPFWSFVRFWEDLTKDGEPDTRKFTYLKRQKGKRKIHTFEDAS